MTIWQGKTLENLIFCCNYFSNLLCHFLGSKIDLLKYGCYVVNLYPILNLNTVLEFSLSWLKIKKNLFFELISNKLDFFGLKLEKGNFWGVFSTKTAIFGCLPFVSFHRISIFVLGILATFTYIYNIPEVNKIVAP